MWLSLGEYPVGSRNDQRPRNARYVNKLTSRVSVFPLPMTWHRFLPS